MKTNWPRCHLRFFTAFRMTTLLMLLSSQTIAATLAPVSVIDVAQRGLPLQIETTTADIEIDVPLLTADGNILHLLGMAHPQTLSNPAFAEITLDLVGVTQPDCTAHVAVLIDATTRRSLAQKLKMTCLGSTIHDAFIQNRPLPSREGRGEGASQ